MGRMPEPLSRAHRLVIEPIVQEHRQIDLFAHRGYVILFEEKSGGMPPVLAVLGVALGQRQHVVGGTPDGA
jgi:hypothetical protein